MKTHEIISPCPVETTLNLIGSRWKVLIIRDLLTGKKRFGELKRSLSGISTKVLTSKLRQLEEDQLIGRVVTPSVPLKVEYFLTDLGLTLTPVLEILAAWGKEYKEKK